jgi:hypothetical protein
MRAAPRPAICNSHNWAGRPSKAALPHSQESPIETPPPSGQKKDAAHRNADSYFVTWERRTSLVKEQVASESAANDAKTIKLRALRLAKEAADKENAPPPAPDAPRKRAARKTPSIKD